MAVAFFAPAHTLLPESLVNLKPPSPFNSIVGLAYMLLLVAAFFYAYNNVEKLRTALGGPVARPDGAKVTP